PRKLRVPIPVVFGVGICASCEELARDVDEPGRSLRRTLMKAGVARIKQRLPTLNPARLARRIGHLSQTLSDGGGIAEHELGEETRVCDAGMPREQPQGARLGASGCAAEKFFDRGGEGERLFLHMFAQLPPGLEAMLARDDRLSIVQGEICGDELGAGLPGKCGQNAKALESRTILSARGMKQGFGLFFELLEARTLR